MIKVKGSVIKPPNLINNPCVITLYIKGAAIELKDQQGENPKESKFNFEFEELLYPLGIYLKIAMDSCHLLIKRTYIDDLTISFGKPIKLHPIFEEDELLKIYIDWIK